MVEGQYRGSAKNRASERYMWHLNYCGELHKQSLKQTPLSKIHSGDILTNYAVNRLYSV